MLIEFSLKNFLSFKEKVTLSLEASSDDWLEENHVAQIQGTRLLKSAAIYGANASGKSNFLKGMDFLRTFVQMSSKESQVGEDIPVSPFRLSTGTDHSPSHFEIVFIQDGVRYRYGFEADSKRIYSEWLFKQANSIRETRLFTRERGKMEISSLFKEGKGLEKRTRTNALFLSVASQFNGEISGSIVRWMKRFRSISGLEDGNYMTYTAKRLKEPEFGSRIRNLTRFADVGIEDLRVIDVTVDERQKLLPKNAPDFIKKVVLDPSNYAYSIKTLHGKFDELGKRCGEVELDLKKDASAGTEKFVGLTGPILDTLEKGNVLFVDELEARLHPLLTKSLVALFGAFENNKNAQLIFATHDDGLLDASRIRRDQVWFVEKDDFGASQMFSLAEFKIRKESRFAKEYLLGHFGAIPHLRQFERALVDAKKEK